MISRFFIDRPIFANVIAIITVIFGVVAMYGLPVERYPAITPPTIVVSTTYPGANARDVASTVAAPLEQEINGVENMMYMSSTSSADGSYSLTITFEIGTKLDDAQVLVQNRLALAEPRLPDEVRRQGVTVKRQSSNIILAISLTSPSNKYDGLFLSNYATLHLRDELSRVAGVGEVTIRGIGAYSMRIWIDPDKLAARQLTTKDVSEALARQNVQVAAGQIGQQPSPAGQAFQMTVTTQGRLSEAKQFEEIVVKSGAAGQIVYLRDVARVEFGAQTYDSFSERSGMSSANVLIFQLPGSNAMEVAQGVRDAMKKLAPKLPEGVDYNIPFDTTKFVEAAIHEVKLTILEAGGLVLIVILVFLHSWRALLVPATTVPVTILGAFAFMPFVGFSINLLTLFGLILAIGIVVDDAIVIVENASHHMEKGMGARAATIQAMSEVTGPVIAITLVLMAVFLPTAFLPGITGQMYRQFALTIAATAFLSAINALTLKPAQCAQYLRPVKKEGWFARAFEAAYRPVERGYARIVRILIRVWWLVLLVFLVLAAYTAWLYLRTPKGFLPDEDQGWILIAVQLPDSASVDRTHEAIDRMNAVFRQYQDQGKAENWFVLGGFSMLDQTMAPNAATVFVAWTDWSMRRTPETQQEMMAHALQQEFAKMREARVIVIVPPAIMGLGFAGGFQIQVEDREDVGPEVLQERTMALIDAARRRSDAISPMIMSTFRPGVPQVYLKIDREKAEKMGVKMNDIHDTLQATLGAVYVNDLNKYGRVYQVRVQAESNFRADTQAISRLEVPGRADGPGMPPKRVPLGTLLTAEPIVGPQSIMRYNLYPVAQVNGRSAPGVSSGEAIQVMEEVAAQTLPRTMGYDWTGMAYQEKRVSNEAVLIYGLAVLFVYLVLAAQYESWLLPFAVILVVPLGVLGVVGAVNIKTLLHDHWSPAIPMMDNNIYTQIGIVLIIALASKNAILIVEFARELRHAGRSITESALEAARLRFRPIIMTSFAFILGVAPLVFATGAGAASRQSLGTAVFGGMITSTVLAVFFVPAFFVAIQKLIEVRSRGKAAAHAVPAPSANGVHPPAGHAKSEKAAAPLTAS